MNTFYPRALVRTEFRRFPAGLGLRSDQGHPNAPTPPTGAPVPPAPTPPATPEGEPSGQDPQAPDGEPKTYDEAYVKKLRDQAAGYRTKYQTAQQTAQEANAQRDKVLAALGMKPDGSEAVDPDKLGAQLAQYQARDWERAVENTILRKAGDLGVNADDLLDSNRFLDSLTELDADVDAADFGDKLAAHVTAFVTQHPKFKAAPQGAGRSGGDFGGGPNLPPASLDAQIAEAQKAGDFRRVIALQNQKFGSAEQ